MNDPPCLAPPPYFPGREQHLSHHGSVSRRHRSSPCRSGHDPVQVRAFPVLEPEPCLPCSSACDAQRAPPRSAVCHHTHNGAVVRPPPHACVLLPSGGDFDGAIGVLQRAAQAVSAVVATAGPVITSSALACVQYRRGVVPLTCCAGAVLPTEEGQEDRPQDRTERCAQQVRQV